jgi:hypothetical protein
MKKLVLLLAALVVATVSVTALASDFSGARGDYMIFQLGDSFASTLEKLRSLDGGDSGISVADYSVVVAGRMHMVQFQTQLFGSPGLGVLSFDENETQLVALSILATGCSYPGTNVSGLNGFIQSDVLPMLQEAWGQPDMGPIYPSASDVEAQDPYTVAVWVAFPTSRCLFVVSGEGGYLPYVFIGRVDLLAEMPAIGK